jgi:hypothetical protein
MLAGSGQLMMSNSLVDPFTARSGVSSMMSHRDAQNSQRGFVQPTDRSSFTQRAESRGLESGGLDGASEPVMESIKWDRAPGGGFLLQPPKTPDAGRIYATSFTLKSPTSTLIQMPSFQLPNI